MGIADALCLEMFDVLSGVDNLDPDLTINGITESPQFRYKGGDADATNWDEWIYGATMTRTAGTHTYNWGSPGLGANDDSILLDGTGRYTMPDASTGQIQTQDAVFELVCTGGTGSDYIAATRTAGIGWSIRYYASSNQFFFDIEDATGQTTVTSAAVDASPFYHIMAFLDRSGSGQIYIQGQTSGSAVVISGRSGTLDNSDAMVVGARTDGVANFDGKIAYFAMWKRSAWLDTHAQNAIAADRSRAFWGTKASVALETDIPRSAVRGDPAYLYKYESGVMKAYLIGANAIRMTEGRNAGDTATIQGGFIEEARVQDLDESNDFSAWTKEKAADTVIDDNATGPDGESSYAEHTCDNVNTNHGISDTTPGNLSAATHCFSAHIGTGNADWFKLEDTTVANCEAWFNVTTGAVGTVNGGVIEAGYWFDWKFAGKGGANRRPWISFTGTAAPHTFRVRPVDGDGVETFSGGDGAAVTGYYWEWQVEEGSYPSSPMPADGATSSRAADDLEMEGLGNVGHIGSDKRGRIECDILFPNIDLTSQNKVIAELSDGGSANDRIQIFVSHVTDELGCIVYEGGGLEFVSTAGGDLTDGVIHSIAASWVTDGFRLIRDGSQEDLDSTCDIPGDIDRISVGQDRSAANQFGSIISKFRCYNCNQ